MLRRYLDVCRQCLPYFVLAAILVPLLALGSRVLVDRSALVTARLWVEPPTFMIDPSVYGGFVGNPPQTEATLMAGQLRQLIGTDAVADRVLLGAQPGFSGASQAEKSALRRDLRNALLVAVERGRFLVLEYRTDSLERGVAVLTSVIHEVGMSAPLIHFEPKTGEGAAGAELRAARSAVGQAFSRLAGHGSLDAKPEPAAPMSTQLGALLRAAESTRIQYRRELDSLTGPGRADPSAAPPQLQQAVFRVIDPPRLKVQATDSLATLLLLTLAATAAAELMIVYLIGLHDPRVRSGKDVEKRTGIPYLGSTGVLRPRAG